MMKRQASDPKKYLQAIYLTKASELEFTKHSRNLTVTKIYIYVIKKIEKTHHKAFHQRRYMVGKQAMKEGFNYSLEEKKKA